MRRKHTILSAAIFLLLLFCKHTTPYFIALESFLFSGLFSVRFIQSLSLDQIAKALRNEGVCAHCLHDLHLASFFNMLARKLVQFYSSFVFWSFFSSSPFALWHISLINVTQKNVTIILRTNFFRARMMYSVFILHWINSDCSSC